MDIGERLGLGNLELGDIKKQSSVFLRDKIKSARIWLTKVPASQLLAEEATNDDDWGPVTKDMAAISDACYRFDEHRLIMSVLQGRLKLVGMKHWRQLLKTLTVIEYLLLHGPVYVRKEFESDSISELTHFTCIDDRTVDRGTAVQNKAKKVLQLLEEDDFLKEERERAQKLSMHIVGQGNSQSSGTTSSQYSGFVKTPASPQASKGLMSDMYMEESHIYKKFDRFEGRNLSEKRGKCQAKAEIANGGSTDRDWRAFGNDVASSPVTQSATESSRVNFSNPRQGRSSEKNGASAYADNRGVLRQESPRQPAGKSYPDHDVKSRLLSPLSKAPTDEAKPDKPEFRAFASQRSMKLGGNYLQVSPSRDFKLPPPPPTPKKLSRVSQSEQLVPDLIDMNFDTLSVSDDPASFKNEILLNEGTPPEVPKSEEPDEAAMSLLVTNNKVKTSDIMFLVDQFSPKAAANRDSGSSQADPNALNIRRKSAMSFSAATSSSVTT